MGIAFSPFLSFLDQTTHPGSGNELKSVKGSKKPGPKLIQELICLTCMLQKLCRECLGLPYCTSKQFSKECGEGKEVEGQNQNRAYFDEPTLHGYYHFWI